jgi:hypothetical protein
VCLTAAYRYCKNQNDVDDFSEQAHVIYRLFSLLCHEKNGQNPVFFPHFC